MIPKRWLLCGFCILALFAARADIVDEFQIREWCSKDGARRIEGRFLNFTNDSAVIETTTGKKGRVRFDNISDGDWLYLSKLGDFDNAIALGHPQDSTIVSNRRERLKSITEEFWKDVIILHDSSAISNNSNIIAWSNPIESDGGELQEERLNSNLHLPEVQTTTSKSNKSVFLTDFVVFAFFLGLAIAISMRHTKKERNMAKSTLSLTKSKTINACVPVAKKGLCFLDLETTGLNTTICDIIEISLCDENGMFTTLIDPGRPIPARATEINGINGDMVIGKPMFKDIAGKVWQRVKGKIIVGHNVSFDLKFLYKELRECGIDDVSFNYVCTCDTEKAYRGPGGNKLYQCLERRGYILNQTHRAEGDVQMLMKLYELQCEEKKTHYIQTFGREEFVSFRNEEVRPTRPIPERKRSSFSFKSFSKWGTKADFLTQNEFRECLKAALKDFVLDEEDMASFEEIGISQKCGEQILRNFFEEHVANVCSNGKITWQCFDEIRNIASLLCIPNKTFLNTLRRELPHYKTVCYTGNLIRNYEIIDRYGVIYPWSIENGFLPMDCVTKQIDYVVYCSASDRHSTKVDMAEKYNIRLLSVEEFSECKTSLFAKRDFW